MRDAIPGEERLPWRWLLLAWLVLLVPASLVASLLWTDSRRDMAGAFVSLSLGWLGSAVVFRRLVPRNVDAAWAEQHRAIGVCAMLPVIVLGLLASFVYMR